MKKRSGNNGIIKILVAVIVVAVLGYGGYRLYGMRQGGGKA